MALLAGPFSGPPGFHRSLALLLLLRARRQPPGFPAEIRHCRSGIECLLRLGDDPLQTVFPQLRAPEGISRILLFTTPADNYFLLHLRYRGGIDRTGSVLSFALRPRRLRMGRRLRLPRPAGVQ